MKRRKLQTAVSIALAVALSTSAGAIGTRTEVYASEVSYSYSFENVEVPYSGTWVTIDGGFRLYLPLGWTESTILGGADGTGVFYTASASDASGWYLLIAYYSAEYMGGAMTLDTLLQNMLADTENYSSAMLVGINGTNTVLYDSASGVESGICFSESDGGIYWISCGPTNDADFSATGAAMLMSLTADEQESSDEITDEISGETSGLTYPIFTQSDTGFGYSIMEQEGAGTYQQMLDSCTEDGSVYYEIPYYSNEVIQLYESANWTGGLIEYAGFIDCVSWLETMHGVNDEDYRIDLVSSDISRVGVYGSEWGTGSDTISLSIYTDEYVDGSMITRMTEMGTCQLMSTGEYGYVYWMGCALSEDGVYSDYIRCVTDSGTAIDLRFCEDGTLRVCSGIDGTSLTEGTELECLYIYRS